MHFGAFFGDVHENPAYVMKYILESKRVN